MECIIYHTGLGYVQKAVLRTRTRNRIFPHLHGNDEHKGLITKLSQRAGIIRKLSFVMPKERLIIFAEGLFFSLLNYCIEVYGNLWGLGGYDKTVRHSNAFRKEDNSKIQVLVKKYSAL